MINSNYIQRTFRNHLSFIIFAFFLVGIFQFSLFALMSTVDILDYIKSFIKRMPPQFQLLIGEEFLAQFSINGIIAFGFNHPLVLTILVVIAISLPSKHISGEIESGNLELLFSLPIRRFEIAFSLWICSIIIPSIIIFGGWLGILIGKLIYPEVGVISLQRLLQLGTNLWLLILTINAITFLFASYSKEGNKVAIRIVGITLFFFFLNYTAKLWPEIGFLKHFTFFNYYQPQYIMLGQASIMKNILFLSFLIIACIILAFRKIISRDIPG